MKGILRRPSVQVYVDLVLHNHAGECVFSSHPDLHERNSTGADADAESPPPVAAAAAAPSSLLPGGTSASGCGSSKVIRVWNPFSGLKLMGARHKAGSHILDLATLPGAVAAATAMAGTAASPPVPAAAVPGVAAPQAPAAAGDKAPVAAAAATAAMTDSAPDMDAILNGDADAAIAEACPDYDTARECGGLSGSKHSAGVRSPGKASLADAAGSASEGRDSGGTDEGAACDFSIVGAVPGRKVPAAAADYVLPHKASQKCKKKERKMKRRQGKC